MSILVKQVAIPTMNKKIVDGGDSKRYRLPRGKYNAAKLSYVCLMQIRYFSIQLTNFPLANL